MHLKPINELVSAQAEMFQQDKRAGEAKMVIQTKAVSLTSASWRLIGTNHCFSKYERTKRGEKGQFPVSGKVYLKHDEFENSAIDFSLSLFSPYL